MKSGNCENVLRGRIGLGTEHQPIWSQYQSKNQIVNCFFYLIPLVWLFADPVFFVEYGGKSLIKVRNGMIPKVFLWELDIRKSKFAKKHPEFEGVFVCSVSTQ